MEPERVLGFEQDDGQGDEAGSLSQAFVFCR